MTEPALQSAIAQALLVHYDFDLGNETAEEIVNRWVINYEVDWLPLAAMEALYQGRYKAISVQQILTLWKRRGQAIYHFNGDFERLIHRHLPPGLRDQIKINPPQQENPPPLIEEETGENIAPQTPELSLDPALAETSEPEVKEATKVKETPQQSTWEFNPGGVKHTDFHSKLKSVADKNPKSSEEKNE